LRAAAASKAGRAREAVEMCPAENLRGGLGSARPFVGAACAVGDPIAVVGPGVGPRAGPALGPDPGNSE